MIDLTEYDERLQKVVADVRDKLHEDGFVEGASVTNGMDIYFLQSVHINLLYANGIPVSDTEAYVASKDRPYFNIVFMGRRYGPTSKTEGAKVEQIFDVPRHLSAQGRRNIELCEDPIKKQVDALLGGRDD